MSYQLIYLILCPLASMVRIIAFSTYNKYYTDFLSYDRVANEVAKELGLTVGDKILITSGYAQQHGSTNTLRIIDVK